MTFDRDFCSNGIGDCLIRIPRSKAVFSLMVFTSIHRNSAKRRLTRVSLLSDRTLPKDFNYKAQ